MRIAFIKTLTKAVQKNKGVMLLTADLGFNAFEELVERFPRNYLNVGVSEQNMAGVAAGMAIEDKTPFIYSIIPFATMRDYEQLRNDICYQNLNVKIVGVGSGFSYGPYGHTHHGLEDLAITRVLPNLTIFSPADPFETEFAVSEALKIKGPVYIRLGKAGEPNLDAVEKPEFGKGRTVRQGKDVVIFSTGAITANVIKAARILENKKISAKVISIHTIKPLDKDLILDQAKKIGKIVTVEEHFVIGGLGSAVAEVIAESGLKVSFRRVGAPDRFTKEIGMQEFMREKNGLDPDNIAEKTKEVVSERS